MAAATGERRGTKNQQDLWDKFWKDSHGNVVVWQPPNFWLYGWLAATLISMFTNHTLSDVFWYVAMAFLTVWAVLEIVKGVNYLRRTLGVVVLLFIIMGLFHMGY